MVTELGNAHFRFLCYTEVERDAFMEGLRRGMSIGNHFEIISSAGPTGGFIVELYKVEPKSYSWKGPAVTPAGGSIPIQSGGQAQIFTYTSPDNPVPATCYKFPKDLINKSVRPEPFKNPDPSVGIGPWPLPL